MINFKNTRLYIFCSIFVSTVIGGSNIVRADTPNEPGAILERLANGDVTAPVNPGFGLETLKHLLFDDALLFTLFSALALLIALLGAAILIGKRK